MSNVLTREGLQKFSDDIANAKYDYLRPTAYLCHPLDAPFYQALLIDGKDMNIVTRLQWECGRKYRMGALRNIEKWNLPNLIEQYTKKLASVRGNGEQAYHFSEQIPSPPISVK